MSGDLWLGSSPGCSYKIIAVQASPQFGAKTAFFAWGTHHGSYRFHAGIKVFPGTLSTYYSRGPLEDPGSGIGDAKNRLGLSEGESPVIEGQVWKGESAMKIGKLPLFRGGIGRMVLGRMILGIEESGRVVLEGDIRQGFSRRCATKDAIEPARPGGREAVPFPIHEGRHERTGHPKPEDGYTMIFNEPWRR